MSLYSQRLQHYQQKIEQALPTYLPTQQPLYGSLVEAMTYACTDGGKRLRPVLLLEWMRLGGGDVQKALPFACALEMIHSYSLVHDDMPCMDDSPLRRGKPSVHKRFGEDMALLTGDALLNRAFEVCLAPEHRAGLDADAVLKATALLAERAGVSGMIGGQAIDLQSEGKQIALSTLEALQMGKTAALLRAACCMGALLSQNTALYEAADAYGTAVGLCFQIVDDILDATSTADQLGKPIGGDEQRQKSTYVTLLGLPQAHRLARQRTEEALGILSSLEGDTEALRQMTEQLLQRRS